MMANLSLTEIIYTVLAVFVYFECLKNELKNKK